MDVNIGSMADPDDVPGLAHFLEHLLFMGTAKYPKENDYNKVLMICYNFIQVPQRTLWGL